MATIKKLKIKQPDGSFSEPVNIGALASNVLLNDGSNVEGAIQTLKKSVGDLSGAGYITKDVDDLINYTTTDKLEASYATKDELNNTNDKVSQLEAKVSSVYTPKGSVNTYAELADKEASAQVGDVWDVKETGKNYAWTDQGTWDDLGGLIDLSNYYTKEETYSGAEIDDKISGVIGQDLKDYLKVSDAETTYAKIDDLDQYITSETAGNTFASKVELNNHINDNVAHVTAEDRARWDAGGSSSFSGDYNDLTNKPTTGTSDTEGLTKLYSETGSNTDGAMTQDAVTKVLEMKTEVYKASDLAAAQEYSLQHANTIVYWTE